MNRFFILLLGVFILCSCDRNSGSDNIPEGPKEPEVPENPDKPDKGLTLEEYYDKYFNGYKVKDTTALALDIIGFSSEYIDQRLIAGLRNKKLWIGLFDGETKEQISEFTDSQEFKRDLKIHKGYGEYVSIYVSSIEPVQFFKHEDGSFAVNVMVHGGIASGFKYIHLFSNSTRVEHTYDNEYTDLTEWYNNSYLVTHSRISTIFDRYGTILLDDIEGSASTNMAVSYMDFLWIGFLYSTVDTQPTILSTWIGNHAYNKHNWAKWLPILQDKRAKYEYKLKNKEENIWTFLFDVVEYSGEEHSHNLIINVDTGEIILLDGELAGTYY